MDTVPRMPMLCFELKAAESNETNIADVLRRFIRVNYNEDPDSYHNEIKELENLRRAAISVASVTGVRDENSCAVLKRYYAQLHSIRKRFSVAKDYAALMDLSFKWIDTYTDNIINGDINYEMLCILLNIGLVHMELGSVGSRSSDDACKVACTHFRCAVYAFEQVNEETSGATASKDMARDLISFYLNIAMAQAQECIVERSLSSKRKSVITAKVAAQASEYYSSALMVLLSGGVQDIVETRDFKSWKKYTELKIFYFASLSYCFMGLSCIESEPQAYGQAIAWFTAAEEKLAETRKHLKSIDRQDWSTAMNEAVKTVTEFIQKKAEMAKKENDFIFHDQIPTPDKLTAVKGAPQMVDGIKFKLSDVLGRDIFQRLVPIEAYETSSIYSDKKDNLLRDVSRRIEEKNLELESFLSSLNLNIRNLRPVASQVPDELIEICAALTLRKNFLENIEEKVLKLDELRAKAGSELQKIRELIAKEKEEEKKHQALCGKRPLSTLIETLEKELEKHSEKLSKTTDSDAFLKNRFLKALPDLQKIIGSGKQLSKVLPEAGSVPIDESNLKRLEEVLLKVDEMKAQRIKLEKDLRDAVASDDVLTKVMMSTHKEEADGLESMFAEELKKFDQHLNLLNMNLSAQDKIIEALTSASADYAPTRRALLDCEAKRRQRTEEIIESYEAVQTINSSAEKGISFYEQFLQTLASLESRVKSVCEIQSEERAKNLAKNNGYGMQMPNPLATMNTMAHSLPPAHDLGGNVMPTTGSRLKDFLPYMKNKNASQLQPSPQLPPQLQPLSQPSLAPAPPAQPFAQTQMPTTPPLVPPAVTPTISSHYNYQPPIVSNSYVPYSQPTPTSYAQPPVSNFSGPSVAYQPPPQTYAPIPQQQPQYHQDGYIQPQQQQVPQSYAQQPVNPYQQQQQFPQNQQTYPQPHSGYPTAPGVASQAYPTVTGYQQPVTQMPGYWQQPTNGHYAPPPVTRLLSADLLTEPQPEASDPNPILLPTPASPKMD